MPTVIDGTWTIKEVMQITYQYARNRFEYRNRDVVKQIKIQRVRKLSTDRKNQPTVQFRIESRSYPQYKPYFDAASGRKYQRRIKHEYDVVLEMDRLSLNTKTWRGRLGAQGKWEHKPPQRTVKQIYRETRAQWKKKYTAAELKEQIKKHKARANYLDVGDYNARVKGINGDFLFRCAYAWNQAGHLFGRQLGAYNVPAPITNPNNVVFFPKHMINVIEVLMNRGVFSNA